MDFIAENPDGWIINENYRNMIDDIIWEAAIDIIWLDYSIYIILWRMFFRIIDRIRNDINLWDKEDCIEIW